MSWTPEQLRTLASEGQELAQMAELAELNPGKVDFALLRISLAARRIAEIVMPQDLIYKP